MKYLVFIELVNK